MNHEASSIDPYFFNDEIDRMLTHMREERKEINKKYNKNNNKNNNNNSKEREKSKQLDLFSSLLERQKLVKASDNEKSKNIINNNNNNNNNKSNNNKEKQINISSISRIPFLQAANSEALHILSSSLSSKSSSSTSSNISNLNDYVKQSKVRELQNNNNNNNNNVKYLQRALYQARSENILLRREMYGALIIIRNCLDELSGLNSQNKLTKINNIINNNNNIFYTPKEEEKSAWKLYEEGKLLLTSDEAKMVRDLKDIINLSIERYSELQNKYSETSNISLTENIEQNDSNDEVIIE